MEKYGGWAILVFTSEQMCGCTFLSLSLILTLHVHTIIQLLAIDILRL